MIISKKIAFEKAGIIKPDSEVILYQQSDTIMDVIKRVCHENKANLHLADVNNYTLLETSYNQQIFSYKELKKD